MIWFLLFALVARAYTFGDLNHHSDELLFFYTGQQMHYGALPYVDIWDRKPPSVFLLYYLMVGISRSVLAYQVVAWLFAALTALAISSIAERFARRPGGMLAGTLYLATMLQFGGAGGQPAVFFNLPTAVAALLVLRWDEAGDRGATALFGAMACAGLTITFKQTAIFESVWLGCFVLWRHGQRVGIAESLKLAVPLVLIGALPMLLYAAFYAAAGHFPEFWHAIVTANLTKAYDPGGDLLHRARIALVELAPLLLLVVASLASRSEDGVPRAFLAGWLIAAMAGAAVIPNLIDHYLLPLLVPLAVAAALFLGQRRFGPPAGATLVLLYLLSAPSLDFGKGIRSRDAMLGLVADIRAHDPHPRLLVYDGPVYLYALIGSRPPTPLIFPLHISYRPENDTSHLETAREFRHILAWRPTTIVTRRRPGADLYNPLTREPLLAYIASHCRERLTRHLSDADGEMVLDVHLGCAAAD